MTNAQQAFHGMAIVPCPKCGDRIRLYGVEPHVRLRGTEVHTYVCDNCNVTEVIVVPLPSSTGEVAAA